MDKLDQYKIKGFGTPKATSRVHLSRSAWRMSAEVSRQKGFRNPESAVNA